MLIDVDNEMHDAAIEHPEEPNMITDVQSTTKHDYICSISNGVEQQAT